MQGTAGGAILKLNLPSYRASTRCDTLKRGIAINISKNAEKESDDYNTEKSKHENAAKFNHNNFSPLETSDADTSIDSGPVDAPLTVLLTRRS